LAFAHAASGLPLSESLLPLDELALEAPPMEDEEPRELEAPMEDELPGSGEAESVWVSEPLSPAAGGNGFFFGGNAMGCLLFLHFKSYHGKRFPSRHNIVAT
jgi:hypothetical protein